MPRSGRHPAQRHPPANPSGVHFLAAGQVVDQLIRSCPVGRNDLVFDLGAGLGAATAPLARTCARVIAIERDPEFVRRLRLRLIGSDNVRVVADDVRTCPLPRREFAVVASIPYSVSTAVLRRLLHPRSTYLTKAALIVEWGFARRVAARVPRSRELAWWAGRFEIELARRVPASCFRPAPRVDSAHLTIRRRADLNPRAEAVLWALLGRAYGTPRLPARAAVGAVLTGGRARQVLTTCAIDPALPAGSVPAQRWADLARHLAHDSGQRWPRLR